MPVSSWSSQVLPIELANSDYHQLIMSEWIANYFFAYLCLLILCLYKNWQRHQLLRWSSRANWFTRLIPMSVRFQFTLKLPPSKPIDFHCLRLVTNDCIELCFSICLFVSIGTCNPINGQCFCPEGWTVLSLTTFKIIGFKYSRYRSFHPVQVLLLPLLAKPALVWIILLLSDCIHDNYFMIIHSERIAFN